ncbi:MULTISPECIES: hypothetical protein [Pseudomonas]|uniref:Uncharacterized protein n=2 Tax=Pseudomonas asplenii TaxID=53407 RepID=A0A0M9GJ46_9PSED|nr:MULTISPECIES: hypothetical protein [Pseudomonas]KPA92246.1 hypothetical protein PF66_00919 [Pseudomonas fuscovaginae]
MNDSLEHSRLALPVVPQAHRRGIGRLAAEQLSVCIPAYPGMDEGDLLELFWDGCYVTSRQIQAGEQGQPVSLRVPQSFVLDGVARIHYRLMRIGRMAQTSPPLKLPVKLSCPGGLPIGEENQGLAPPIIPSPIRRYGVNPNQMKRGVPLTLEPYPNMAAEDEITLLWGDVRFDLPKLTPADIGKPVTVFVPAAVILEAGEDRGLDITYCVIDRVGNNSRWAPPRRLRVGAARHFVRPVAPGFSRAAQRRRE